MKCNDYPTLTGDNLNFLQFDEPGILKSNEIYRMRQKLSTVIDVFKITHNLYDPEVSLELRYYPKSNTRGNKYKLLNYTFNYVTRKYSFTARIVNIWNSLPNSVVDVDTVCLLKARLDKFWMHQDVLYDFTADLTGIADRSVRESS